MDLALECWLRNGGALRTLKNPALPLPRHELFSHMDTASSVSFLSFVLPELFGSVWELQHPAASKGAKNVDAVRVTTKSAQQPRTSPELEGLLLLGSLLVGSGRIFLWTTRDLGSFLVVHHASSTLWEPRLFWLGECIVMSSSNDMSLVMVVAKDIHHGSYGA